MIGKAALQQTLEALARPAIAQAREIAWSAVPPTLAAATGPLSELAKVLRATDVPRDGVVVALESGIKAAVDLVCLSYANAMCGDLVKIEAALVARREAPPHSPEPTAPSVEAVEAVAKAEIELRSLEGAMAHYVSVAGLAVAEMMGTASRCGELWRGCMDRRLSVSAFYDFATDAVPWLSQRVITLRTAYAVLDPIR